MITVTWKEHHGFVATRHLAKIGPDAITVAWVSLDRIADNDKPWLIVCDLPGIKPQMRAADLDAAKALVQRMVDTFAQRTMRLLGCACPCHGEVPTDD